MSQRGGAGQHGEKTASMTARRKARKRALDVLYEADLRQLGVPSVLNSYIDRIPVPQPEYLAYTRSLVEGVYTHRDRIDELLSSYIEGWSLERMPIVDRNLARIAVFELLYQEDIDNPIAISEAVDLAGILSTDDSPRFLNGLLGRISEFARA